MRSGGRVSRSHPMVSFLCCPRKICLATQVLFARLLMLHLDAGRRTLIISNEAVCISPLPTSHISLHFLNMAKANQIVATATKKFSNLVKLLSSIDIFKAVFELATHL